MIQVLDGAVWYDGIVALAVDGGKIKAGVEAKVYAIYSNKTPKLITEDMLGDDLVLEIPETSGAVTLKKGEEVIASGAVVVEE
jgi:hypothetical protein